MLGCNRGRKCWVFGSVGGMDAANFFGALCPLAFFLTSVPPKRCIGYCNLCARRVLNAICHICHKCHIL